MIKSFKKQIEAEFAIEMKGNMHQYFGLIITCMFKYLDYAIIAIFTQNKALIYE